MQSVKRKLDGLHEGPREIRLDRPGRRRSIPAMLVPVGDDNSDRRIFPILNYALIGINVLVFVLFQGLGSNTKFTYAFSTVPKEILTGKDIKTKKEKVVDSRSGRKYTKPGLRKTPIPVYLTLLTAMFMHGGIAHLLGNMLFLFIFGDNLEDLLGRLRYLLFYLVSGILAGLAHVATVVAIGQDPLIPALGASGAISGVLAGYLLSFPKKDVHVILFRTYTTVPAWAAVGVWFVFQIVNGLGMLGGGGGGVAYGAHIGGFLAGLVLIKPFAVGRG